jgi:hypothetical protein
MGGATVNGLLEMLMLRSGAGGLASGTREVILPLPYISLSLSSFLSLYGVLKILWFLLLRKQNLLEKNSGGSLTDTL